jgi:hypothetical protein
MNFYLVCVHPFANYVRGQQVTDEAEIRALLADDRINYFVRVAK